MRKNLTLLSLVMLVAAGVFGLVSTAHAQQPVGIYGYDTGTFPDGGIVRKVKVDSQGRLVTAGGGSSVSTDGGLTVAVPYCLVTASKNTTVGTSSIAVPATPLAARWSIRVCNSPRNTGSPIITCTSDGTTPTATASSAGDALEVGDCATYLTQNPVKCISDTAGTAVPSEECK